MLNFLQVQHASSPMAVPLFQGAAMFSTQQKEYKEWFAHKASLPPTPLQDVTFVVFDLELTECHPERGRITEIAALKYKNGVEIDRFVTYVNPGALIPKRTQDFNGITQETVEAHGVSPTNALNTFSTFVGPKAILVAQNIRDDLAFLHRELERHQMSSRSEQFTLAQAICTKTLGKEVLPLLYNKSLDNNAPYSLDPLSKFYGIENPQAHRAEADARTTALLLNAFIKDLQEHPHTVGFTVNTIHDLFSFQGRPMEYESMSPMPLPNLDPAPWQQKLKNRLKR